MQRLHPLARPFGRCLRSFERNLLPAIEGEVEPLHQCRVATRRLRELARLTAADLGAKATRKPLRRLRQTGRALGPVREIDVALGLVGELTADGLTGEAAVVRLRQHLDDLRSGARRRMIAALDRGQALKLGRQLHAVAGLLSDRTTGAWAQALSLRMNAQAGHLREMVDTVGVLYVPDRVHAVRIAAKKLRYTFELAADAGVTRRRVPARRLKAVQDTLGRLHDIEVLTLLMHEFPLPGPLMPLWVHDIEQLRQRLEAECRRLHSGFLGQRRELVRAAAAAVETAARIQDRRPGGGAPPAPLKMTLSGARKTAVSGRRRASGR